MNPQRKIKVDPLRARIIEDMVADEPNDPTTISIDSLLQKSLQAIDWALAGTMAEMKTHGIKRTPPRECVANLKDCLAMLSDLKKKEEDLLDSMSDEDLEKLTDK